MLKLITRAANACLTRALPLVLLAACLHVATNKACAQATVDNEDNSRNQIDGDTVKVAAGKSALLSFIGPVQNYNVLSDDYSTSCDDGRTVILKAKTSSPERYSQLIINEGSQSSQRQHTFIIQYVKSLSLQEQRHDFSSMDKIHERIAFLERQKKAPRTQSPSDNNAPSDVSPRVSHDAQSPADIYVSNGGEAKKNITTDEVIKGISPEALKKRVDVTIQAFYQTCTQLINGTDISSSLKYGMKLFNNDESILVERSNARTHQTATDKIRKYFRSLTQLNYSKVEMTAANISFISSKIVKGLDGKYHTNAVVLQDFKGFNDNIIRYQDQTTKTIEITIEVNEIVKDGKLIEVLQVFLGNISVNDQNK